jgi:hypothetical protein
MHRGLLLLLGLFYYSGYFYRSGYSTALVTLLLWLLYCAGYFYGSGYSVAQARIVAVCALKLTFLMVLGDIVALCATISAEYLPKAPNSGF